MTFDRIRNRYPGKCCVCGQPVERDGGYVVKGQGLKHPGCLNPRRHTYRENLENKIAREAVQASAWRRNPE